jgi:hypothetical protein
MEDANKYNPFDIIGSIIAIIILITAIYCTFSGEKKPVKYYPDPYEDIDAYK